MRQGGFQASGFRMPRHTAPCASLVTLGCQIRVANRTPGALNGYSAGSVTSTANLPPAYGVPGGPVSVTAHVRRSDSEASATLTPSGGDDVHSASSWF